MGDDEHGGGVLAAEARGEQRGCQAEDAGIRDVTRKTPAPVWGAGASAHSGRPIRSQHPRAMCAKACLETADAAWTPSPLTPRYSLLSGSEAPR